MTRNTLPGRAWEWDGKSMVAQSEKEQAWRAILIHGFHNGYGEVLIMLQATMFRGDVSLSSILYV